MERIPKVYLETTVFNWYFDDTRSDHESVVKLFEAISSGEFEGYTSDYVVDELLAAATEKRDKMLALISEYNIIVVPRSDTIEQLARVYLRDGVVPEKKEYDSLHIATAAIYRLNFLVSYNFKHINRAKVKTETGIINHELGYYPIQIIQARELFYDDEQ